MLYKLFTLIAHIAIIFISTIINYLTYDKTNLKNFQKYRSQITISTVAPKKNESDKFPKFVPTLRK